MGALKPDRMPAEDTARWCGAESVLKRTRCIPGANHYYIHAVEPSKDPQKALPGRAA